jgi:hypothetical protein
MKKGKDKTKMVSTSRTRTAVGLRGRRAGSLVDGVKVLVIAGDGEAADGARVDKTNLMAKSRTSWYTGSPVIARRKTVSRTCSQTKMVSSLWCTKNHETKSEMCARKK